MKVLGIGIILCLIWSPEARAQVFPGALAGDKDLYVAVGGVATTLTSQVAATATTFSVASVANMQPYELLVVDNEIVEECSFSPGTLQITIGKNSCPGTDGRGIGGTSAATHANGARITDLITGEHHNAGRKEIEAIEIALGPNLGNIPGSPNGPVTPLTKGGTGASTQPGALANILGVSSLTANGLCFTQTGGPATCITPGAIGTVLTSTGPNSTPNWQTGGGTGGVSSVFGRMGTVAAQAGDYTAALVTNAVDQTQTYANPPWLTSLAWTKITGAPAFITNPMLSPGDFIVGGAAGAPTRLAVPGTGTFCPNWSGGTVSWVSCPGSGGSGLTSVGITMPSAFTVSGSPLTSNGVITIAGAGSASQYINGLGQLATLPPAGVTSVFGRSGAVVATSGDYTTSQVTEGTNLYYTNARVYAAITATAPIVFTSTTGVISCPTCGTGTGTVTSVFGRTGVVVAATNDYNATQVTNAENVLNKDTNGGYVGRDAMGNATIPGTLTAYSFVSSDTTHTSQLTMIPGVSTNTAAPVPTGDWGLYLDSANGNKLTRQDSGGNKIVIEGAAGGGGNVTGAPYTQSFTSQTSVALAHNLNLTNITAFNIACFDTTNTLILPSTVTATNANTVTVTFAVATSGSCTITTGGTASGGGGITGPGTTTNLFVPQWSNTTGTQLAAGLPVTQTGAASALVETGTGGTIAAALVPVLNQSTTGNASTATALASTPTQCVAGQFATGIAASGAANCALAVTGPTTSTLNLVPRWANTTGSALNVGLAVTQNTATANALVQAGAAGTINPVLIPVLNQSTTGNAATATALAAVPTQCTTGQFATGIAASGNANCSVGAAITGTPATGNLTQFSGAATITNGDLSGDVSTAGSLITTLATVNTMSGACGDATHVCQVTTNGKGLVTSQSALTITGVGATTNQNLRSVSFAFDGGGSALSGTLTRCSNFSFSGTIQQFALVGDVAGSATITVKGTPLGSGYTGEAGFAGYTAIGTESPSATTFLQDTTLTGWTTAFAANTAVCVQITAAANYKWISGEIRVAAN